ncbi:hypothetical protein AGMMS50229_13690 [Campylobacterota bacterium]|nr:hypothetical protein AGMMS50229_13690 [Campylobacterota bacterium]
MKQQHLGFADTVNLGSFYTPEWVVDIVYEMIGRRIPNSADYRIVDTSCGYGSFLRGANAIGADIDLAALAQAQRTCKNGKFFHHNSLLNISRKQHGLTDNEKIVIVGNPPYNDTTSIVRNRIKRGGTECDHEVFSRDLGISFLLSYDRLKADFVCVLHPLSYLIKKTNFSACQAFKNNYRLIDGLVISSAVFSDTSKTTHFPILIALYERNTQGMDYNFITNYSFKTDEKKQFSLSQFDTIDRYINKYPNRSALSEEETIAYFWTMRDINALKRSKTFVKKESSGTIRISRDKLAYYCYVDLFKRNISHIPYYFGNLSVIINHDAFLKIKDIFVQKSAEKHTELRSFIGTNYQDNNTDLTIENYFRDLLKDHYID